MSFVEYHTFIFTAGNLRTLERQSPTLPALSVHLIRVFGGLSLSLWLHKRLRVLDVVANVQFATHFMSSRAPTWSRLANPQNLNS